MMARSIGAAPRQRGNSEACRLKQPNFGTSRMRAKRLQRFVGLQRLRREDNNAEPPRLLLYRRRLQLHAAPAGLWRARVDGGDLMAMGHKLPQRRHGKIRRAHEDQTKWHVRVRAL
jgi:hypothetical protein